MVKKLICIDVKNISSLTYGKLYKIVDELPGSSCYLKDDNGHLSGFRSNRFATIEEYRDMKISLILN